MNPNPPASFAASPLSVQDWAVLEQRLDLLLGLPEVERGAWLDRHCPEPEFRRELESWLAAEQQSRDFLAAAPAQQLQVGEAVGSWRVLALIGRGGSGEVYRVERADGAYEQQAALKLLSRPEEPEELRRFAAERRLLARLEHPDIARLLDGGAHRGRLYAVLELVEGERLDHYLRPLGLDQRLRLFQRICAAVAHAHRHLVVHRDLKPANVLVSADGRPKLLDFGIAKVLGGEQNEPLTTGLRLTPDYCAPEQLRGGLVTPATDVFALGVMLHQLLSGQLPWRLSGQGLQRALERLASDDLEPPSRALTGAAARRLRGDLDAIVLKCLRREPSQRYASAEALAEDLQRYLDGRPVLARGDAPGYLLGRLLRRYRLGFSLAALSLVVVVAASAGMAVMARRAALERDIAREEAERSAAVKDYLLTLFRVAGEAPGGETLTPKQLLDKGAERLQLYLQTNPEASADTLLALAELYFRLNDYTGAAPLFEQLLRRQPPAAPATLAKVQLDLAQCYLRMSRYPEARAALEAAQAYWARDPQRYRNLLLESRSPQAQLERSEGHPEQSIATLQAAVVERIAVSGEQHPETGTLLNDLAVAHFQANQLPEARAQLQRAWQVWESLKATESVDALNTLNNWAAIEVREQRLAEAEALYRRALNVRRSLFGPSAALAALLNNLGKLQLRLGRPEQALPLLQEAVALAREYAGENSLNALAAMAGLGEAQAVTGEAEAARATLAELERRTREHFGDSHLLMAITHLAQARRLQSAGQARGALRRLEAADQVLAGAGPQAATYQEQVNVLRRQLRP